MSCTTLSCIPGCVVTHWYVFLVVLYYTALCSWQCSTTLCCVPDCVVLHCPMFLAMLHYTVLCSWLCSPTLFWVPGCMCCTTLVFGYVVLHSSVFLGVQSYTVLCSWLCCSLLRGTRNLSLITKWLQLQTLKIIWVLIINIDFVTLLLQH